MWYDITGKQVITNWTPAKKIRSLDSFHKHWWSINPAILLDKTHNWSHPTKRGSLTCYLLLMIISMQKSFEINWFISGILMINESCILIEQAAKHANGHTQPKVVVSDATIPWWLTPYKKAKAWLDFFHRY